LADPTPPSAGPTRRGAIIAAAGLATVLPAVARASEWLHDPVVFYTDVALRPVLEQLGASYLREHGIVWRVYAAAPINSLGLLAHGTQDDVLITLAPDAAQAEASGLIAPGRRPLWRTTLVFAALGAPGPLADFSPRALLDAIGGGRLAITDPTPTATFKGYDILARAGLASQLDNRTVGAIDTEQAAGMLRTGDATVALLHASEAATLPGLRALMPVPPTAYDPIDYEVALTKSAWSRNQARAIAYLEGLQGDDLRGLGLELLA